MIRKVKKSSKGRRENWNSELRIPNFLGLNVFFIFLKICVMLGFFPKEGFLEPLSKILIFHGFCSERSYYTFFKNHNIYVDNKLVENPKILVDREKNFIKK